MRKLKKAVAMLGFACLLSSNVVAPVYANEIKTVSDTEISPRWSYLQTLGISLDIESNGLANCYSAVISKKNTYQCKVESTLYRIANSGFETVVSFSDTGKGVATAAKSIYVKSGYVYVLRSKFMVYDSTGNTLLESHVEDYEQEY